VDEWCAAAKRISESQSFARIDQGIGHFSLCAARHWTERIRPFTTATPASETTRGAMKSPIRQCSLLLAAFTVWAEPALARSFLNCLAKKVVIVDAPRGSTSSSIEENLGFWIDEPAKTLVLADGTPLTVRRFDDRWISAARGDMSYEFDRQNGNLMYASSTTKEGSATIIIGSGRCSIAVGPAG
jgi:hypothetical protein